MSDGFAVDRAALAETAKGLTGAVAALKSVGITEDAEVGMGFSNLALSASQAGAIAKSLSDFCNAWEWGVAGLVSDGREFGQRLGLSVSLYNDAETQAEGSIKQLVASVAGDPYMSSAQAAKASWSQDAAIFTGAKTPGQDMTAKQASQEIRQQWDTVGKEAVAGAKVQTDSLLNPTQLPGDVKAAENVK